MDNSNTGSGDDVIPNTTSDRSLPDTGGVPLYGVIGSGLVLAGAAVMLISISPLRPGSGRRTGRPPSR